MPTPYRERVCVWCVCAGKGMGGGGGGVGGVTDLVNEGNVINYVVS